MVELSSDAVRRVQIHAALADPGRLVIVDRLLLADASPSELQTALSMSSSLVAHHLGVLEGAGIVRRVRSEGDRRRSYLRLIPESLDLLVPSAAWHAERVVFVCTQNSARSQLAVAVWNRRSSLPATSAGTHPAAEVHPSAVAAAARRKLPMRHWSIPDPARVGRADAFDRVLDELTVRIDHLAPTLDPASNRANFTRQ